MSVKPSFQIVYLTSEGCSFYAERDQFRTQDNGILITLVIRISSDNTLNPKLTIYYSNKIKVSTDPKKIMEICSP